MVQALSPNRTNDSLNIRPLPRGSRGRKDFLDSHVGYLSAEVTAEDGIAIAEQVAGELVKGKGFSQLLPRPFRRRMSSHIAVDNATPVMGQHQKHIENLETNGRHSKEVDGDQLLQVILQEGAPSLRWRFTAAHHVFAHAALVVGLAGVVHLHRHCHTPAVYANQLPCHAKSSFMSANSTTFGQLTLF
jgi:hypothetical protein